MYVIDGRFGGFSSICSKFSTNLSLPPYSLRLRTFPPIGLERETVVRCLPGTVEIRSCSILDDDLNAEGENDRDDNEADRTE